MRAIVLMIAGVTLFAVVDGVATLLARDGYPTGQVIWSRYAFVLPVVLALAGPRRWPALLRTRRPVLQIVRALLPLVAGICIVLALRQIALADATAILFVAPLAVTALAIPLLGERVDLRSWAAVALGFVGVLVIVRPTGGSLQWAALLPLATAVLFALYQIATRDAAATFFYTMLVGTVGASLALPFGWRTPDGAALALMVGSGLLHGLGHYCTIRALALAQASTLAPYAYTQILGATLLGYLFFGEVPDLATFLGAGIIALAGLYVVRREVRPG
jgi:drug/metabolite transporter (DMT)-like permease